MRSLRSLSRDDRMLCGRNAAPQHPTMRNILHRAAKMQITLKLLQKSSHVVKRICVAVLFMNLAANSSGL